MGVLIDIILGTIVVLISVISFIWTGVGAFILEMFMIFSPSNSSRTIHRSKNWWEKKSSKIMIRITSLFFIGLVIFFTIKG